MDEPTGSATSPMVEAKLDRGLDRLAETNTRLAVLELIGPQVKDHEDRIRKAEAQLGRVLTVVGLAGTVLGIVATMLARLLGK